MSFQMYYVNQDLTVEDFLYDDDCKISLPGSNPKILNNLEGVAHQEYPRFNLPQELPPNAYVDMNNYGQNAGDVFLQMSDLLTTMSSLAPASFLRPKGPSQAMPVIRPRGIDLKDGPLFAALSAKIQGKHVGVPVCEGAATTKSLGMHLVTSYRIFHILTFVSVLVINLCSGCESMREWLFFDKPRRVFDNYNARPWHESRKQVMKDFGGLKRSYYMDPQPSSSYEWHLYDAKSKFTCSPLIEIQQQMVRLSADGPVENKRTARAQTKDVSTNIFPVQNNTAQANIPDAYEAASQVDQMTF
ncbi:hypothetical protein VPH35_084647 [Triticum aestivum]